MPVRPAERTDVPAILDIYNEAVLTTTASYDLAPVSLASRLDWFDHKRAAGQPVFVWDEGGQVLGWSAYGPFREKPGYAYTAEHSVYVGSAARGRGLGKALMLAVVEHARAAGKHVLVGGLDADNAASLALHRSLGFTQVAHFRQVGRKFGRWLDLVFMELRLDEAER
ncbi:N-acetyltransferase family protein [Deinococcus sp. KNUC1210]|uniref:GNAT family N-acetyltransferase n=1 Tax=Deinococcus sp. KNUC1210 TaxID=2917691 RepID=UPI001EF067BE|nr:GNAT family N-acetyltransferase [Deinococcus sp. KNUC1210]ULH15643.1 N-acetyltransferase family protein [Deinococcus sp. KNUC1210]